MTKVEGFVLGSKRMEHPLALPDDPCPPFEFERGLSSIVVPSGMRTSLKIPTREECLCIRRQLKPIVVVNQGL